MNVCDLFAGIGGFSLGLERAGFTIKYQVEIDKYCNKVLEKHWPNVQRFKDVREVSSSQIKEVDLICGGFPCQPFSFAGKRRGKKDDRYLWPEMLRIIRETRPTWVVGENVAGFINLGLKELFFDLETLDYEVQPFIIPACSLNAPHRRDRIWIVGYTTSNHNSRKHVSEDNKKSSITSERDHSFSKFSNSDIQNELSRRNFWKESWYEVATRFCRVDDGIPNRLDRLKALGNAIVPQIAQQIGLAIMNVEKENYYV